MPSWEFEPTPGPWPYLGAGLLTAIGGASLLWAQLPVPGAVLLVAGLLTAALATRRLLGDRRTDRHEP